MGSTTTNNPAAPPPVDYSAMMAYASDNNKTVAMGQIMAQQFAMQQASMDRQMQIAANLELGLEKLDTKLQIAKLDFISRTQEEMDRHEEKIAQIGGDVDAARAGGSGADTESLVDFLNNGQGGYNGGAEGGAFDNASDYADSHRNDGANALQNLWAGDQANQAGKQDMMADHTEARTEELDDWSDTNAEMAEEQNSVLWGLVKW